MWEHSAHELKDDRNQSASKVQYLQRLPVQTRENIEKQDETKPRLKAFSPAAGIVERPSRGLFIMAYVSTAPSVFQQNANSAAGSLWTQKDT